MTPAPDRLVWLLRHAKTVADPPSGGTDHERRLAPRGRRDADALGHRLGDAGDHLGFSSAELPGLILTSSATRTVQTTERVLAEMTDPPAVTRREALYDASVDEVLDELRQVDDATHAVMVVGHNPTAHALAMEMIAHEDKSGRRQVERRGFPTCALAVYRLSLAHWSDIAEGTATVVGLFTPPY